MLKFFHSDSSLKSEIKKCLKMVSEIIFARIINIGKTNKIIFCVNHCLIMRFRSFVVSIKSSAIMTAIIPTVL